MDLSLTFALVDMDQGIIRVNYPRDWTYDQFKTIFPISRFQEQLDKWYFEFPDILITEVEFR